MTAAGTVPVVAGATPTSTAVAPVITAHGSVGQVYVTGARRLQRLVLRDGGDKVVARGRADKAGSLLFRGIAPGRGYRLVARDGELLSKPLEVLAADDHPSTSSYESQQLGPGYGYLTTRDGTQLAVNVRLPGPAEDGPYPTVVEYSGYDPANPDSDEAASRLAATLGYATVGVNMRGTGCSGGAWEYFETLQALDGYDAIEVVAAQPWVQHGTVGMVGISFSGITQLFVAATRPPHLSAITPLSVIDDTYRGVLYPGGILNTGFALEWAEDRQDDAEPAPEGGQRWARERIEDGDEACAANQALRLQTRDVLDIIEENRFYDPALLDAVNPDLFVDQITVPTFLAGAWQDEQTGGHWPRLISRFSPDTTVRATITNGTHTEPFFPSIVTRWGEFLDFYVARRVPSVPEGVRATASILYASAVGVPLTLPPDRFTAGEDFDAALERYESEPSVRVLFDNGAGETPGAPIPTFEASFDEWPPSGGKPTSFYLAGDGQLAPDQPSARSIDSYDYDPDAMPRTSHPSEEDDYFSPLPAYDWRPAPDGATLAYVSEPFSRDTVVVGPGTVDLWLRSTARDVDLEVVVTEVRPDGKETYVQSGWLRASHRALDPQASTELEPVPTHTRADASPLPPDRFTKVAVSVFPFGHAFRAGSRLRLIIQAPGGNRPRWAFDALVADGEVTNDVARGGARASRLVVPVVSGIEVPKALPRCPALRGQPCRDYVP